MGIASIITENGTVDIVINGEENWKTYRALMKKMAPKTDGEWDVFLAEFRKQYKKYEA